MITDLTVEVTTELSNTMKCKLTRKVTGKDNNTKVLFMYVTRLKVSDSFSKLGNLYIKDDQCNNIEYPASSSNKIQPSIYNKRSVIKHPLKS